MDIDANEEEARGTKRKVEKADGAQTKETQEKIKPQSLEAEAYRSYVSAKVVIQTARNMKGQAYDTALVQNSGVT